MMVYAMLTGSAYHKRVPYEIRSPDSPAALDEVPSKQTPVDNGRIQNDFDDVHFQKLSAVNNRLERWFSKILASIPLTSTY